MSDNLTRLFHEVTRSHRGVVAKYLEQYDLYFGQPKTLFAIEDKPGITLNELVCQLGMSKESLSVSLNRLETNGLIQRKIAQEDRRIKKITLTPKGKKTVEACRDGFNHINKHMFDSLDETEKDNLSACLSKILSQLEEL